MQRRPLGCVARVAAAFGAMVAASGDIGVALVLNDVGKIDPANSWYRPITLGGTSW